MSAAIQGIYIALFGRPADPGGLAYWTEVTKGGADLSEMLRVLPATAEYQDRFAGKTPDEVITAVYLNLFGRTPEAEGLAYFKEQLSSGAQTLATIAVSILHGAQGDDKADVDAKVNAAQLFTDSLDTPEEIEAYKGTAAADLAKKFIDTVDKDNKPTADDVEKAADAVVAGEDPSGAPAPNPGGGGGGGGGGAPTPTQQELFLQHWKELDAAYYANPDNPLYNDKPLNLAKVELANEYVAWLKGGNSAITTIVQTRVNGVENPEARQQSLHDNILGELSNGAIADRFPDEDPRSLEAAVFGTRPWSGGYDGDTIEEGYQIDNAFYQAAAWDLAHGVSREAIDFPAVVAVQGSFTIDGVAYNLIVQGTDAENDAISFADGGTNALGVRLHSEGLEVINNSHLRPAASPWVADIDLSGANGLKEVWTDYANASYLDLAYYSKASQDTVFGIANATAGEKIILVRYAENGGDDDTAHFALKNNHASSYVTTGTITNVENLDFFVHANNAGSIGIHGNFLKEITVSGEAGGNVSFLFGGPNITLFDASASFASVKFGAHEGVPMALATDATLLGGHGDDVFDMSGLAAKFIINGGAGNDSLRGGSGADTFVFDVENFGNDTIHGFEVAKDILDFGGRDFTYSDGNNTVISVDGGGTVTLMGVSSAQLLAHINAA